MVKHKNIVEKYQNYEPINLVRQGENFKTMLDELGLIQADFANVFGFSTTSVSEWCRGKSPIRIDKATKINERYPQYPIDWIRGFTPARDKGEAFELEKRLEMIEYFSKEKAVATLAKIGGGYTIENMDDETWIKLIEKPEFRGFRIQQGKDAFLLSAAEWVALVEEATDFVCFKLWRLKNARE